jgi:outer membrane immunogenic protein
MFRKVMLAMAVVVASGSSYAADLGYRTSPLTTARSAYSWSGFYVGMNGGYGLGKSTLDSVTPTAGVVTPCSTFSTDCKLSLRGTIVGGTVGFNLQASSAVFGIEADLNYQDARASLPVFGADELETRVNWFGTLRGRLGYAYGALMPFVTGGLYVQHATASYTIPAIFSGSRSDLSLGWTIGGGVEYALDTSWSVKAEYLYARVDDSNFTISGFGSANYKNHQNIVRAGLNYRY